MDRLFLPEMLNLRHLLSKQLNFSQTLMCVFLQRCVCFGRSDGSRYMSFMYRLLPVHSSRAVVLLNSILFLDFNLYICVCFWFYVEAFKLENTVHKTFYTHKYISTHKKLPSHSKKINISVSYVMEQVIKSYLNTLFKQFF